MHDRKGACGAESGHSAHDPIAVIARQIDPLHDISMADTLDLDPEWGAIDLIEELALEELQAIDSQSRLVEFTPPTLKEPKVYLVKKNADGTYSATLNGRKVARKEIIEQLGKLYETQSKDLVSKLQEQTNSLKKEVEEKLLGKKPVESKKSANEPVVEDSIIPVESNTNILEDGKVWYKAEKKLNDKDGNEISLTIDKNKKTNHFYIKAKLLSLVIHWAVEIPGIPKRSPILLLKDKGI